jgi:hypothetical protein
MNGQKEVRALQVYYTQYYCLISQINFLSILWLKTHFPGANSQTIALTIY